MVCKPQTAHSNATLIVDKPEEEALWFGLGLEADY